MLAVVRIRMCVSICLPPGYGEKRRETGEKSCRGSGWDYVFVYVYVYEGASDGDVDVAVEIEVEG